MPAARHARSPMPWHLSTAQCSYYMYPISNCPEIHSQASKKVTFPPVHGSCASHEKSCFQNEDTLHSSSFPKKFDFTFKEFCAACGADKRHDRHHGSVQVSKDLKEDCIPQDEGKCRPLEVTKLEGAEIGVDSSLGKPFAFKCAPQSGNRIFYFCATSNQEMKSRFFKNSIIQACVSTMVSEILHRPVQYVVLSHQANLFSPPRPYRWLEAMEKAVHPVHQNHVWVDVTMHNTNLPPLAIKNPECLGLLQHLDKNKDTWVQHYCILKDGCLYFYDSIRSTHTIGGIYLQGYMVSEQSLGSRRSVIEVKPPSEEFETFYLCAESVNENKRQTQTRDENRRVQKAMKCKEYKL
ncbi:Interactor protein for cytohesin exchange factors 1 [Varanus komodoensis]|nr:Interactor protein for cytohesin exchange factors 1 [Varanus komodoensis]